ncbi:MAG: hypothetical protein HJHJAOHD_02645 [Flavobacteriales bacterium]|nr:hypothetical protein [Flavobacteriales bacterium]
MIEKIFLTFGLMLFSSVLFSQTTRTGSVEWELGKKPYLTKYSYKGEVISSPSGNCKNECMFGGKGIFEFYQQKMSKSERRIEIGVWKSGKRNGRFTIQHYYKPEDKQGKKFKEKLLITEIVTYKDGWREGESKRCLGNDTTLVISRYNYKNDTKNGYCEEFNFYDMNICYHDGFKAPKQSDSTLVFLNDYWPPHSFFYIGFFVNGKREGFGKAVNYSKEGNIVYYEGIWNEDKFITEISLEEYEKINAKLILPKESRLRLKFVGVPKLKYSEEIDQNNESTKILEEAKGKVNKKANATILGVQISRERVFSEFASKGFYEVLISESFCIGKNPNGSIIQTNLYLYKNVDFEEWYLGIDAILSSNDLKNYYIEIIRKDGSVFELQQPSLFHHKISSIDNDKYGYTKNQSLLLPLGKINEETILKNPFKTIVLSRTAKQEQLNIQLEKIPINLLNDNFEKCIKAINWAQFGLQIKD